MDEGRPVGIVSMRSLVEQATSETLELMERIEGAESFEAIAAARAMSHAVCSHLLEEGIPGDEVSQVLSRINRDLHRQVLEGTMRALEAEGWGGPPATFCFILMGSHGRHENHFNTDQDHGMILANYPPAAWHDVEPYFMELGTRVSERLTQVGFGSCRGQVMSANPVWRKPVGEWKAQIQGWYANPSSNAVRYSTLFYDFQPVWGEASLARELRAFITEGIQRNHPLLRSLYNEASRHKVPLTWFRNFITEKAGCHKGQMDLKRSGFLFVVECARILALRHGVTQTGTVERLEALSRMGVIPREEAEFVQTAYKTLLHFLLTAQAGKLRAGETVDNYIEPRALSIQERYTLRHALEATSRLQRTVHAEFGEIFF
jgi:CBS domain-containing protein